MTAHRITVEPEARTGGRHTWNWICSCGALGYGALSQAAAKRAAAKHQQKENSRG